MIEERTFYRYIAKIYETDQVIYVAESERSHHNREREILQHLRIGMLKAFRWYVAIIENVKSDSTMEYN
jgi:hypothetical protein